MQNILSNLFAGILGMSYAATWLILAVLLLRFVLRRAPRNMRCILWALVGLRLLCPFFAESPFSLVPPVETVGKVVEQGTGSVLSGTWVYEGTDGGYETEGGPDIVQEVVPSAGRVVTSTPRPNGSLQDFGQRMFLVASIVWLTGILLLALYAAVSCLRLSGRVREGVCLRDNVWLCDGIQTPFILGVLRPRIYLPSGIEERQMHYILAHERAHLKRGDQIWKPLGYLLLMLHWFNPLVWVAYILLSRDIELACDEKVVKDYDLHEKKLYSTTLLECSISRRSIAACPLAFGEVGVKERIRSVLSYKKPQFWVIAVAAVLCVVVAVGFLTNPRSMNDGEQSEGLQNAEQTDAKQAEASDEMQDTNDGISENGRDIGVDAPENVQAYGEQELIVLARKWAEAFCDRDGGTIAALASDAVREDLKSRELLWGEEGDYAFGMSSPWPWNASEDYIINTVQGDTVEVLYYAMTSDPHVTVWGETLTFGKEGDTLIVTGEELIYYDAVSSGGEFARAYSFITGTPADYAANGLGEALNSNALLSSSNLYRELFDPKTAAIALLNLLDNPNKVELTLLSDDLRSGNVGLEIHFLEDDVTATVSMVQPYGALGIWIPQNYFVDALGRFMNIPWNEVEARNLTVDGDISDLEDIICIGELPEYGIKMYGYNDTDTSLRGVAVQIGEDVNYFDWYYATTRFAYPKLYWNEKSRQLYVALYNGTGTGFSNWELHVLQAHDTGALSDNRFDYEDYEKLLQERVSFQYDEETRQLRLYEQPGRKELATVDISDLEEQYGEELGSIVELSLGDVSEFDLGNKIRFQVQTGILWESGGVPEYEDMPVLEGDVLLNDDGYGEITFDLGELHIAK